MKTKRIASMTAVLFVAVLAALMWAETTQAAMITVNTTADETTNDTTCSLREAITSANNDSNAAEDACVAGSGADVIILPGGPTYVLGLANAVDDEDVNATGDLDFTDDSNSTTITGDGPATTIIDAADIDRVIEITTSGVVVTMSGLTIRNGTPDTDGSCDIGGGIFNNNGDLTLNNVVVTLNNTGPGGCDGGGIANNGTLLVQDSTISGNDASNNGGGVINLSSGLETFERSTISGNTAVSLGGGIYDNNDPAGVTETTRIVESTISGNIVDDSAGGGDGGGLYADANTTDSHINIINSTFSGNNAAGTGGGILVCYGTVNLRNVTITANTAGVDGGGMALPSCGESQLNLRNSIVAANTDTSVTQTPDCFFASPSGLTSEDFNLIGDETGCDALFTGGSDQFGSSGSPINPRLGSLADNGGPTLTHVLLTTPTVSPAIDTANSAGCFSDDANSGSLLTTDQRGSIRPFDGGPTGPSPARCDIGALELGACGDGFQDPAEACDDGNIVGGDGCSATCEIEACANGTVDVGEECDDGNTTDGDGCDASCVLESCGDGVVQTSEGCDDGNTADGDGCGANCILESCGDGVANTGEECDDGNSVNTDACLNTCRDAVCGDGLIQANVEGCDDSNTVDGDGCSSTCTVEPALLLLLGDGGCSLIREGAGRVTKYGK